VILAGVMMLDYLGMTAEAGRLEQALMDVLREGKSVTPDLRPGSGVGTRAMTQAVLERLQSAH